MGRPAKFSRSQLQTAALALVDAQGLAGLSMRALAAALGTGPMTLYNHVADRADLEVLVVEAVLGEARWPVRRAGDWRGDVRAIATAMWRAVRGHPHVIPLVLTRRTRSPATLGAAEALLAALARGGRSGSRLLAAFRAVTALVAGFAQGELAGPLTTAAGEPAAAAIARVRALPAARYPRLHELARAAARSDAESEFRRGLELLLAGLAAETPARPRRRPRSHRR
jgi:AcrR family transcriptional regulator